jgi:hypothetical protein
MAAEHDTRGAVWGARVKLIFGAFALVAAFFLIAEHRAHLLPYVPWLLLIACPLMHLFMHGGHGGHGGQEPTRGDSRRRPSDEDPSPGLAHSPQESAGVRAPDWHKHQTGGGS